MAENKRILIVDDNLAIHEDFRKILISTENESTDIAKIEAILFEEISLPKSRPHFVAPQYELEDAYQGEEAIRLVEQADKEGRPYALIFMDVRMPPGLDGIETIARIWEKYPHIEMVICTAYADYSWDEIIERLGATDHLLFLKKPFHSVEIKQIALSLTRKWNLNHQNRVLIHSLEKQTAIIKAMFQFANRLNFLGNLDDVLSCILETVTKFIDSQRVSILLIDESGEYLRISKSIGLSAKIVESTRVRIGQGITGHVFQEGKPKIVNSMSEKGLIKTYSDYDAFISSPFICAPLIGHKVKLGVINITNKRDNQLFTEADADIVSYISYTAAVAINNQLNELKLEESFVGTIKALAEAIEAKDPYTRGHSERVAEISEGIARELGLEKEEIRMIKFAGILHDIGKIGVPEAVLRKPHPLDAHEYSQVRQHPDIGENILKNIATFDQVRIAIRQHHERIDGTGYPDALKGDEISLGARIIAVADTYDAMNSDRPYRQQRSVDYIQQELNRVAGQELDSRCLAAFFRYLQKK